MGGEQGHCGGLGAREEGKGGLGGRRKDGWGRVGEGGDPSPGQPGDIGFSPPLSCPASVVH